MEPQHQATPDTIVSTTSPYLTECKTVQTGHRRVQDYRTCRQHSSREAVHSHVRIEQQQLGRHIAYGNVDCQDRHLYTGYLDDDSRNRVINLKIVNVDKRQRIEGIDDEHSNNGGNQHDKRVLGEVQPKGTNRHKPCVAGYAPTPRALLERIPVAGLNSYFNADGQFEKRFWAAILLLSTAITLSYIVPGVINFAEQEILVEATRISGADLPFPHLYACVWGGVNGTYLTQKFAAARTELIMNNSRVELLARRLNVPAALLVDSSIALMTVIPAYVDVNWAIAQTEIIYRGSLILKSDAENIDGFYTNSMYRCDKVLIKCEFRGVEFPCCPEGDWVYSAATVACYKINVSAAFTNNNNQPHTSSSRQSELKLLSSIDSRYLQYQIPENAVLGLNYGDTLLTTFDVPDGIPAGMLVFVKLSRRRRILMGDCINRYQFDPRRHRTTHQALIEYFQNMSDPTKYSVSKCTFALLLETVSTMCGCIPHYDTLHPDDQSICKPAHMVACLAHAFDGLSQTPIVTSRNDGNRKDVFNDLKEEAPECLPLCDSWTYDSHMTFAPLGGQYGNDPYIVYNKVIITVDDEYRLENDVLKIDAAAFLATIGDSLSLLLGISLVSFIQVAYWSVAAIVLKKKNRRKLQNT